MEVTDIKGLKVAHFAAFGPGRSGQYGTTRDLILAERKLGIDAQLIDCVVCPKCSKNEGCAGKKDGGIETETMEWAAKADIFVRHSIIPKELEEIGKPIVLCLHGRPENSFLLQKYNMIPVYSFLREVANNDRYKAIVTFWEEHLFYFDHLMSEKPVQFVPAMIDLERFTPDGKKRDYSTRSGTPNIMIADMWREDTTPFNVLFAAVRFREKYCKGARIHLYGVPSDKRSPERIIIDQLSKSGALGDVCTLTPNMEEQYRAADILVTPHVIATRVIREALACNLPVVAGTGNPYTLFTGNPRDVEGFASAINTAWENIKSDSYKCADRTIAESKFNPDDAGNAMADVFRKILDDKKALQITSDKVDEDITFAFSAYGDKFIDNVFVLLQSIDTIYNGKANIVFYHHDIDPEFIEEINTILPYVITKETKHKECDKGDIEYKTAQKSLIWKEILEDNPEFTNVVLIDADAMIVRKMGKFFSGKFDIGFCYKEKTDENPHWPINGGVMLVKNSYMVRSFLGEWAKLTTETQKAGEVSKRNGYMLWGGGDQVSLGHILNSRSPSQYKKGLTINNLKFQGFPMSYFNESRGINPTDKTHAIHYKGKSWQDLLKLGVFSKRRPQSNCNILYKMNCKVLEMWQDRRHVVMKKWSPNFEKKYWDDDGDFHLSDIRRVYKEFNVDEVVSSNIKDVNTVVEVGSGAYGGAMKFFSLGKERYSIDIMMDEFLKMGHMPDNINCIKSDFSDLPINSKCADVVFAWEVLDHALTKNHFEKGVNELCRILKPGGLLFFNHPVSRISKLGHTVIVDKDAVINAFVSNGLNIIEEKVINNELKRIPEQHKELCVVFGKGVPGIRIPDDVSKLITDSVGAA